MTESFNIEGIIYFGSFIVSILLSIMCLTAYYKSKIPRVLYAVLAFMVFSIYLLLESLETVIPMLDNAWYDIIVSSLTLIVVLLFFSSVIKK